MSLQWLLAGLGTRKTRETQSPHVEGFHAPAWTKRYISRFKNCSWAGVACINDSLWLNLGGEKLFFNGI
jgi:hypothetical protein